LRVIEERKVSRLGSNEEYQLDVRFIATSKTDLAEQVAEGAFREDLFYRLNVVTLHVPPLSERREDVPLLFLKLVQEAAVRDRKDPRPVPEQVIAAVAARDWPGNVRELRNAADRYGLGLGLQFEDGATDAAPPQRLSA